MPDLRLRWTINVCGFGAQTFVIREETKDLYLADGWGTAYAAIRLRRLDLETGREQSSVRLGNQARCIAFAQTGRELIAATDTKLFLLDGATLGERQRWDRRVPRYPNQILWRGHQLVMGGWLRPALSIFDLNTERIRRVSTGRWPLLLDDPKGALVASAGSGTVDCLELPDVRLHRIIDAPRFISCALDRSSNRLWMIPGTRVILTADSIGPGPPASVIREYGLDHSEDIVEHRIPVPCHEVRVESGEVWAHPFPPQLPSHVTVLSRGTTAKVTLPDGHTVVAISPKLRVVLAHHDADYRTDPPRSLLSCFSLEV
jgi:hypothetical protein